MSIVVVEGVDASGKTTLLDNLRTIKGEYFVIFRHSCRPLKPYHVFQFLNLIEHGGEGLIRVIDRHPLISEPIYGPILRKDDMIGRIMTPDQVKRRIERTVRKIIYCRPVLSKILKNLENNPQLEGVKEKIVELLEAYDLSMAGLKNVTEVVEYNYEVETNFRDLLFGVQP